MIIVRMVKKKIWQQSWFKKWKPKLSTPEIEIKFYQKWHPTGQPTSLEKVITWPASARASVKRDIVNQTCKQIWWPAIGMVPCRAAIEVAKVIVRSTAIVLPIKRPPAKQVEMKLLWRRIVNGYKLYLWREHLVSPPKADWGQQIWIK